MSDENPDLVYVAHIEERSARIEEIAVRGKSAFLASHVLQDAVIRNFEVIGEAAKHLSENSRRPTLPSHGSA